MLQLRPCHLGIAAVLLAFGLGSTAQAQFADTVGPAFVVTPSQPVISSAPVIVASPAMTRAERRASRRQARYQTMRPTYAEGPGITFAPYSDRYYPRTIYNRDETARVVVPQSTVTTVNPR